eukprot:6199064-Pleurochrysis_carterae.AAC.1
MPPMPVHADPARVLTDRIVSPCEPCMNLWRRTKLQMMKSQRMQMELNGSFNLSMVLLIAISCPVSLPCRLLRWWSVTYLEQASMLT